MRRQAIRPDRVRDKGSPQWCEALDRLSGEEWVRGQHLALSLAERHGVRVNSVQKMLSEAKMVGILEGMRIPVEDDSVPRMHYRVAKVEADPIVPTPDIVCPTCGTGFGKL